MEKLVEIKNLKKYFQVGPRQTVRALDDVSLLISRGETLGLVGESGCGKTTMGRTVVRLYRPTSGQVIYDGIDMHKVAAQHQKDLCRRVQMIFQDPYASLNPRMTAEESIGEALDIHHLTDKKNRRQRIIELLHRVGLNSDHTGRFPHEFSGGQRQRIAIARALAVEPEFIVLDEPLSALDVSIQAQVVNLLGELQERMGLTYLFISHNLSIVRHISDRIAVMHLGRVVELAGNDELYENPLHPYTRTLLSFIPMADPDVKATSPRIMLAGEVPNPVNPPPGCNFSDRCPQAKADCKLTLPVLRDVGNGHRVACHLIP